MNTHSTVPDLLQRWKTKVEACSSPPPSSCMHKPKEETAMTWYPKFSAVPRREKNQSSTTLWITELLGFCFLVFLLFTTIFCSTNFQVPNGDPLQVIIECIGVCISLSCWLPLSLFRNGSLLLYSAIQPYPFCCLVASAMKLQPGGATVLPVQQTWLHKLRF